MMRLLLILAFAGCADPSAQQQPRSYNNHDLGDHLQQTGVDLGSTTQPDLAGVDLAGSNVADLANAADLAKVADLAGPPPDLTPIPDDEPPVYVHTNTTLYRLDVNTYDVTPIGDFGAGEDITDLAEKADGSLIAVSFTSIYTVNAATGHATLQWPNAFTNMNALTYTSDDRLLSADTDGNVYELDVSPNVLFVILLGNYGSGQVTAGDLVSVDDGTTWGLTKSGGAATDTNNVLMIVNNVGGTGTPVGATGFGKLWGTAYSHHRILAVSSAGEIVEINPFTGAGTLKRTHAGLSFYGAASNPTVLE